MLIRNDNHLLFSSRIAGHLVAQSIEHTTPDQEVVGLIQADIHPLLFGLMLV